MFRKKQKQQKEKAAETNRQIWSNPQNNKRTITKFKVPLYSRTVVRDEPLARTPQADRGLEERLRKIEERQKALIQIFSKNIRREQEMELKD